MTTPTGGSAGSVLLSFTAENARSYRDETHLSLLGTRLSAEGVPRCVVPAGMTKPVRVLPAAGIFGANASGKTTILRAIDDMRRLVMTSFRQGSRGTPVSRRPFLLDPDCRGRPTRFEINLVLEGVRWIYGFEVDDERVREEYAYHWPRGRQALVFNRDDDRVAYGSPFRAKDRAVERLLRGNALLLSVAGATENRPLAALFDWFASNLLFAESDNRVHRALVTAEMAGTTEQGERVIGMLRAADLGITGLKVKPIDAEEAERFRRVIRFLQEDEDDPDLPDPSEANIVSFSQLRLMHTGTEGSVGLSPEDESEGTLVWVTLIGPMLSALDGGGVVLVDELDASLHPHLVELVISMFQDPRSNPRNAQLIFNSHDGNILQGGADWALGRDQIWFTEKYADGTTRLYSLDDFSPRRDEDIYGRYFRGRYGGVPVVGDATMRQALVPISE